MSLQNRIADLVKNSGNWRERVEIREATPENTISTVKKSLTHSQEVWKQRIPPQDAVQFTVSGKLQKDDIDIVPLTPTNIPPPPTISTPYFNPNPPSFSSFFPTALPSLEEQVPLTLEITETTPLPSPLLFKRPKRPTRIKKTTPTLSEKVTSALASVCSYEIQLKAIPISVEKPKKLYKIKGKKRPIPIEVEVQMGNLSNHDCFVLVTWGEVYCFYGEYANLREKLKCDEFFHHFERGKCCKVTPHSPNYPRFLSEFPTVQAMGNTLPGDEGDIEFEKSLPFSCYKWDGWGWVREEEEDLETVNKEGLLLLEFPHELFFYVGRGVGQGEKERAETFLHATFNLTKYLTFKKIKPHLEPIEFKSKFKQNRENAVFKENSSKNYSITIETEELADVLTLENVQFSLSGVFVMEEDPRTISYHTHSLTKHHVTLTSFNVTSTFIFHSSHCYLIEWTYSLTYSTKKLDKSCGTTTRGRDRTTWFLWYGERCSPLDRGRLSTLFSVGDFQQVFGRKEKGGEKVSVEEGGEPVVFFEVFGSVGGEASQAMFLKDLKSEEKFFELLSVDINGQKRAKRWVEVQDFYKDGEYYVGNFSAENVHTILTPHFPPLKTLRHTPQRVYKLSLTNQTLKIQKLIHFSSTFLPTENYYIKGNYNVLILATKNYNTRRKIVLNLDKKDDFFIVFSLNDYFNERFLLLGKFVVNFVSSLTSETVYIRNKQDYAIFKEFFNDDKLYLYLDDGILKRIDLNFANLPIWKKKTLVKTNFTSLFI